MIHSHRVLTALAVACVVLISASEAAAQSVLTTLKTLTTIDSNAERTIQQVVKANVQKLDSQDPAMQSAAREALASDGVNGSAAYNDKYATAVAAELAAPAVAQAENARKRLNAAVALARIASTTKSAKLTPAVLAMLDPKQPEAIQLWALKAAAFVLPEAVQVDPQRKPALLAAIVPSIAERLTSALTQEAYEALKVPHTNAAEEVLRLVEARIKLYQSNPLAIDEASVDRAGLIFIMQGGNWSDQKIVTQPQRVRAMQAVCTLATLAAQQGDLANAGSPEREQYQLLITGLAGGVYVAAQVTQQPLLAQVANKVASDAKPQNAQLVPAVAPLCPAIAQVPGFQGIQPLPGTVAPQ